MLGLSLAISEIFARSPKVRERAERVRRSSRMRRSSPLRRCSARERVTARVLLDCNALRICASEGSSADTGPEHANKDKPSIACANPALQTPLRLVMGLFLAETLFNGNLRPIAVAVQVVLSVRALRSAAFWAAFDPKPTAGPCSGRDVRFIERPPHRTVRAAFPHTAPTSGPNGKCLPHAAQRL